jgi:hypothetical protein
MNRKLKFDEVSALAGQPVEASEFNPLVVAPRKARQLLDVGNTKLYELINSGRLEKIKIGRSSKITMKSIIAVASGRQ